MVTSSPRPRVVVARVAQKAQRERLARIRLLEAGLVVVAGAVGRLRAGLVEHRAVEEAAAAGLQRRAALGLREHEAKSGFGLTRGIYEESVGS